FHGLGRGGLPNRRAGRGRGCRNCPCVYLLPQWTMIHAFRTIVGWPRKGQTAVRRQSSADARAGPPLTIWQRDHLGPSATLEAGQSVFPVPVVQPGRSLSRGGGRLTSLRHDPYRAAPIGEHMRLIRVAARERGIEGGFRLFPMSAHKTLDMRLAHAAQRYAGLPAANRVPLVLAPIRHPRPPSHPPAARGTHSDGGAGFKKWRTRHGHLRVRFPVAHRRDEHVVIAVLVAVVGDPGGAL